ncbi:MAG: methyltransferase family protein [Candidatus Hodarchaeales archaeon]|jgi:protein-S-isoprenylcysteine O-methyltransferase Ste14
MKLNDFFFDLLPRVMWIVQVAAIILAEWAIFQEDVQIAKHSLILGFSLTLIVLGIFLFFWSQYHLLRHWSHWIPTKVVREGPFRWIRHPVYVGLYAVILGFGLLLSSLATFVVSACFLPFWIFQSFSEERQMLELFGDDYRGYQSTVGMVFPKIRRRKQGLKQN